MKLSSASMTRAFEVPISRYPRQKNEKVTLFLIITYSTLQVLSTVNYYIYYTMISEISFYLYNLR